MTVRPIQARDDRLSPGEKALWLLQQLAPDLGVVNVAISLDTPEPPRWWPLQESLQWLVSRHAVLRSAFPTRDGMPIRVVSEHGEIGAELDLVDTSSTELSTAMREYAAAPFTLDKPPLLRLGLFRLRPEEGCCRIVLVAHPLVADAASLRVLLTELREANHTFGTDGQPPRLPVPRVLPGLAPRPASLDYWRAQLGGFDLASTRLEPAGRVGDPPTFAGEETEQAFPPSFASKVAALRSRAGSTDAAVLLAAYLLALRSQGTGDDALLGVMVNNRGRSLAHSIGYHVATLPLRVPVDPGAAFDTLARHVAVALLAAVEHADTPFEMFISEFAPVGDDPLWWRSGLIRHAYSFRITTPGPEPDVPCVIRDIGTGLTRFDLELTVERCAEEFIARLLYSTEMYPASFAEALLERIERVIEQVHERPDCPVGALDLRTAAEIGVMSAMNDTGQDWPGPATVPGLIAQAWSGAPGRAAIVDGERTVTYGELRDQAAAVSALLAAHRVRPGDVVALAGPRGAGLAAAVLGTWLAGAAFLPLDPGHPARRIAAQLDDVGCHVVLDGQLLPEPCRVGRACLPVPAGAAEPMEPDLAAIRPDTVAYLIYTSGSTGRPKGVRLSHANLANVVSHFVGLLGAGPSTAMTWLTTFGFDISILELCLPLCVGGRVVVADDTDWVSPERLLDLVEDTGVTVVQATPTMWRMVVPVAGSRLAGLTVLCGGEPLPPVLAQALASAGCRVFNVYGPTETTIWSTVADLAEEDPRRVSVGRPIANTQVYVLDAAGALRPPGVSGELCIAGDGVALGYHGQPELTAERFRTDPVLGRYYRAGDLARIRPDGRVELLGRRDRQVKLRGHRIELAEVEAVVEEHPDVRAACVVLHGDPSSDGHLIVYVAASDRPGLASDIWAHARARLPAYSLPSGIHRLDQLPQTPNGKVDARALSEMPRAVARASPPQVAGVRGPGRPHEPDLVDVWRNVLRSPTLDAHANFFLNGGTSLLAIQLAQAATDRCRVPVSMSMVFRAPTPAALADLLAAGGQAKRA
jgi:amino acid adenylation domain-containing protein